MIANQKCITGDRQAVEHHRKIAEHPIQMAKSYLGFLILLGSIVASSHPALATTFDRADRSPVVDRTLCADMKPSQPNMGKRMSRSTMSERMRRSKMKSRMNRSQMGRGNMNTGNMSGKKS